MRLNNSFIGHIETGLTLPFSGSDNWRNLKRKLAEEDQNWYYRTVDIEYNYNKYGHRCVEPDKLNQDDYILFTGCSHTEGIGLELEKTYPYLLSKKLNCDYYNLSLGGSGFDVLIHNLTIWINTHKKPKLLIVQLPNWRRFAFLRPTPTNNVTDMPVELCGSWTGDKDITKFLVDGDNLNYFKSIRDFTKLQIDSFNLPTIYVAPAYGESIPDYCIEFPELDRARDSHSGIKSNESLASILHEKITQNELNNH